jgi:glycosyltransferase involved in cell wall biosynthesis
VAEPFPEDPAALREGAVTVAYVFDGEHVTYSFHRSMVQLIGHDMASQCRIIRGGYIAQGAETDGLAKARNDAVRLFLDDYDSDWLFWIDTDMGFDADTVDRLLAAADPVERPIVGALAFTQRRAASDDMGGWRVQATPTIFDWLSVESTGEVGFAVRFDYAPDSLVPCAGTGSACVLIHRSVFERIEAEYGPAGQQWYDRVFNEPMDRLVSEDLSFCMRAVSLGIPVHVDTRVKTTHQKYMWLSEPDYFSQVALSRLTPSVPPATEATAVIVPVMRRPQNAAPFMASLRASGADLATVYAVTDEADAATIIAWREAGARVIRLEGESLGTFAEKVNYGYEQTDEPWLLLVGDDVRFHPGWLDHAQHAARDGAHVIGTNDLHNPRVTAGDHTTHPMIRRAYVDERGASWDGPKVVCHEGYRHWYVDDEIVTVAKQRGVWAFARHARIEHLHPLWGLAEDDEVYALGRAHVDEDRALFEARVADHGAGRCLN